MAEEIKTNGLDVDEQAIIKKLLLQTLDKSHPVVAEGILLSAIPYSYDLPLLTALRHRDDGNDERLYNRLTHLPFIEEQRHSHGLATRFTVLPQERHTLQNQFIIRDKAGYLAAQERALVYWQNALSIDPFVQRQNVLYHQLLVDSQSEDPAKLTGISLLINIFRDYRNDRHFAAAERVLTMAELASVYLKQLDSNWTNELDQLLVLLRATLAQAYRNWAVSRQGLEQLEAEPKLWPPIVPYVARAHGQDMVGSGDFAGGISHFQTALKAFQTEANKEGPDGESLARTTTAEIGLTMIALGDAHLELACSVRGQQSASKPTRATGSRVVDALNYLQALPILLYLSFYFGRQVWKQSIVATIGDEDWIIIRLFATAVRWYIRAEPYLQGKSETRSEHVLASERLAFLLLEIGAAEQASDIFSQMLAEQITPLSPYRKARAQVGLGEAHLQLGQIIEAVNPLQLALIELDRFLNEPMSPRAHWDLGEALFAADEWDQSVEQFATAVHGFQEQKAWSSATAVAERLQFLVNPSHLPLDNQGEDTTVAAATALIEGLDHREYQVRFRHPWLKHFRRLVLTLLPLVIILIPLFTINLDSSSQITPSIHFRVAPILNRDKLTSSELVEVEGQAVTAANVSEPPDPELLFWGGAILISVYMLGSLLLGLGTIVLTPPRTVQSLGRKAAIHLDATGISIGKKNEDQLTWTSINKVVLGDTLFMSKIMRDRSSFALLTDENSLEVTSNTYWYRSLRRTISQPLPKKARVDLDFDLWRSWPGLLYGLNILSLILFAMLVALAPQTIWQELPRLPYSIGDFYPYLYVGLFILPLWWVVIRRLRVRSHMNPRTHSSWWVLGAGLFLVGFLAVVGSRPLLTPVNAILPLASILLLLSAGISIWQVDQGSKKIYPLWLRVGILLLVSVTSLLMLVAMVRDVSAYHYRVKGDYYRDQAYLVEPEVQITAYSKALENYKHSVTISKSRLLPIDLPWWVRQSLGVPQPEEFTLVNALTGQAAMQMQLNQHQAAINTLSELLDWTNRSGEVYAWRAWARLGLENDIQADNQEEVTSETFIEVLYDYDRALRNQPKAEYYLWLGIVHYRLGNQEKAEDSYELALNATDSDDRYLLTKEQQTQALIGQGWLLYDLEQFSEALQSFSTARETSPESAETWLALGYAQYGLDKFEDTLISWEEAQRLDPEEPMVLISLGTLAWKLGGISRLDNDSEMACAHYAQSVAYFTEAVDEDGKLKPQSDLERAFTYRTRGQVQFLLNPCIEHPTQALEDAVESYTKAVELDPGNAFFWHMRGRLNYVVWLKDPEKGVNARVRLFQALDDLEVAIDLLPDEDQDNDYRPNFYRELIIPKVIEGTLVKGDEFFVNGQYRDALDHYELLANYMEENTISAFKAGLTSLALGDETKALAWYETGLERALANDEAREIQQAWRELNTYLNETGTPQIDGLTTLFEDSGVDLLDAHTLFTQSMAAFDAGLQTNALALYRQALATAVEDRDIEAVWLGQLSFYKQADPEFIAELNTLVLDVWPNLEAAAASDEAVSEAFHLALIAVLMDKSNTAGQWFNEGIRRTETGDEYNNILRATGKRDLRSLWQLAADLERAISPEFVSAMDAHLPMLLEEYPETEPNGNFWRYRGWFKYYIGSSVFRAGDESFAREILDSGQPDADRAAALGAAGGDDIHTYLPEAAWGWYHIERGDDYYQAGELALALAYYERAAELIQPQENNTARQESTQAAFLAGRTAVALVDFDRALFWYEEGLTRASKSGEEQVRITEALADLLKVLDERPELKEAASPLQDLLTEEAN